jgi:ABC-type multidrug transport system ATPase subunit
MQAIIRDAFARHTIIAVAHRLETILDFDRVLLLDGGQVVEFESPAVLMQRESKFRALVELKGGRRREEDGDENANGDAGGKIEANGRGDGNASGEQDGEGERGDI